MNPATGLCGGPGSERGNQVVTAIGLVSILNVKLLQLFIMEMRTLACGFVISGCS